MLFLLISNNRNALNYITDTSMAFDVWTPLLER